MTQYLQKRGRPRLGVTETLNTENLLEQMADAQVLDQRLYIVLWTIGKHPLASRQATQQLR
ncbi:hypothetical protein D3C85_1767790 [compost metagenome]